MKDYLFGGPSVGFYAFASIRLIGIFTNGWNWLSLAFDLPIALIFFVGQYFYVRKIRRDREFIRQLYQELQKDLKNLL